MKNYTQKGIKIVTGCSMLVKCWTFINLWMSQHRLLKRVINVILYRISDQFFMKPVIKYVILCDPKKTMSAWLYTVKLLVTVFLTWRLCNSNPSVNSCLVYSCVPPQRGIANSHPAALAFVCATQKFQN